MKWLIVPASAALAAALPGTAAANPPTPAHARAYERAYRQVVRIFGRRAPGRNIVKDGIAPRRPATDAQTLASLSVLDRMVAPASSSPTISSAAGSGAGTLPACASESGTNYSTGSDNTNASSGATGRYQITPSTAANYGCELGTSAGQDACAQTIYEHQGASAWVGCGG
jgi:Transglycosylase-like domain